MLSQFKEDFMLRLLSWVFISCMFTIFPLLFYWRGRKKKSTNAMNFHNKFVLNWVNPNVISFDLGFWILTSHIIVTTSHLLITLCHIIFLDKLH